MVMREEEIKSAFVSWITSFALLGDGYDEPDEFVTTTTSTTTTTLSTSTTTTTISTSTTTTTLSTSTTTTTLSTSTTTTTAGGAEYYVGGAGTAAANGTYVQNGEYGGKNRWDRVGGGASIWWTSGAQGWCISPLPGDIFANRWYNNTDISQDPDPPRTADEWWERLNGDDPEPTVTRSW